MFQSQFISDFLITITATAMSCQVNPILSFFFPPEGIHFQLYCALKILENINVAYHHLQHKIASSSPQMTSSASLLPSV